MGGFDRLATGDGPHQDIKVIHTELHPRYDESSGTDIGILYLQHDVKFTGKSMNRMLTVKTEFRLF